MTDNFEHALEKENERLRAEVERLTRERDGERAEREKVSAFKRQRDEEYEVVLRERDEAERLGHIVIDERDEARQQRDEWKARAEAAEADSAVRAQALRAVVENLLQHIPDLAAHGVTPQVPDDLRALAVADHPGAALLELAGLVRYYQRKDELTLSDTFQRLMTERARISEMVSPEIHAALLERLRAAESMRPLAHHDEACDRNWDNQALDVEDCAVCGFDAVALKEGA